MTGTSSPQLSEARATTTAMVSTSNGTATLTACMLTFTRTTDAGTENMPTAHPTPACTWASVMDIARSTETTTSSSPNPTTPDTATVEATTTQTTCNPVLRTRQKKTSMMSRCDRIFSPLVAEDSLIYRILKSD